MLDIAIIVSLSLFLIIGVFDGFYFHLVKYKLHLHPKARVENIIHGVRGVFLGPILIFYFGMSDVDGFVVLGGVLICVDLVLEIIDVYVEKEARSELGGVSSTESVCHILATGFRFLAIGLETSGHILDIERNRAQMIPFLGTVSLLIFFGSIGHFLPLLKKDRFVISRMKVRL